MTSDIQPAPERRRQALEAMQGVFGADARRVRHALTVLGFAETLLAQEPGCREVVVLAAILHDIGIHAAETKHGSTIGVYQEIEGPPIARAILETLGVDEATTDHVCRIIANHHSARDIDTPEFRIVWDADWLVNLPDEFPDVSPSRRETLIGRLFKTAAGKALALSLYCGQSER